MTTLGISGSLQAPGLAVPAVPVRPIPNVAGMLDSLLNSTAGAASVLAKVQAEQRKTALRDNMNKAVGAIMAGERHAEFEDPKVQDFYESGLAWTDSLGADIETIESLPGESPGDTMRRWIETTSGDASDHYKYELFRHVAPKYASLIRQRATAERENLIADGASSLAGRIAADADPEAVEADVNQWGKLADANGWTEEQKLRAIYLPAADAVAISGDVDRAKWIAEKIGGRLPGVAAATVERARRARAGRLDEEIRERIRNNESPNWSPKPLKEHIEQLGNRDSLTERQTAEAVATLQAATLDRWMEDALARQRRGESGRAILADLDAYVQKGWLTEQQARVATGRLASNNSALFRQQTRTAYRQYIRKMLLDGHGSEIQDWNYIAPDGPASLSASEYIEPVFDELMVEVAQAAQAAGQDPLTAQVRLAQRNGRTYALWRNVLSAGPLSVSAASMETAGGVPDGFGRAYDLWRRLHTLNPQLAHHHADEGAAAYYTAVTELEKGGMETAGALRMIMEANRPGPGTVNETAIQELVEDRLSTGWIWTASPENPGAVETFARLYATAMVKGAQLSPERALDLAGERIESTFTVINGWAVNTRNQQLPPNFGRVAMQKINAYVKQYGDEEGVEKSDLAMSLSRDGVTWTLFNKMSGRYVEHASEAGVGSFTSAGLKTEAVEYARHVQETRTRVRRQAFALSDVIDAARLRVDSEDEWPTSGDWKQVVNTMGGSDAEKARLWELYRKAKRMEQRDRKLGPGAVGPVSPSRKPFDYLRAAAYEQTPDPAIFESPNIADQTLEAIRRRNAQLWGAFERLVE